MPTLGDFIWETDGNLTEDFCQSMIDKFDKDDRRYIGKVGRGIIDRDIKQTTDLKVSGLEGWEEEDQILYDALKDGLNDYVGHCINLHPAARLSSQFEVQDTGYQIQRYEPKGFYHWHNDFQDQPKEGPRVFTFIWYLNTIPKVNKGYTEFVDGTRIQPKAGKLVFFPATWTYVHRAYPSPSKEKYICTGWIYGKVKWDTN